MSDFQRSLCIQSWVMYAIGALLIMARIESRRIQTGSMRKLWTEEYIMLFILVNFTFFTWSLNEVSFNGSNFMSDEAAMSLDEQGVKRAVWGSKCTLILELFTLTILWGVKGCLCLMFYRLKLGRIHLAVKVIAGYCILAYGLVTILYLTHWCRPITGYWAVPVKHRQCASYYHHMIFATAWNISADLALFVVPLLIIPKLQLPLKRKIMITGVLCLGVFNILAAIMNRYYNFSHPNSVVYLRWYVGEVGTAIYVVNIPACRPLLQKILRATGLASTEMQTSDLRYTPNHYGSEGHSRRFHSTLASRDKVPSLSESEVQLTGVQEERWAPARTRSSKGPRIQGNRQSDGEEESVVPDGGIMMTTKIVQRRE